MKALGILLEALRRMGDGVHLKVRAGKETNTLQFLFWQSKESDPDATRRYALQIGLQDIKNDNVNRFAEWLENVVRQFPTAEDARAGELVRKLAGDVCECGAQKERRQSFCSKCYFTLPYGHRQLLYRGVGEGYEQAYDNALAMLRRKGRLPK